MAKYKTEVPKVIEYKTFSYEIKTIHEDEDNKEGKIEGYASTFGNIDLGLDIVVKGAFSKTIKESKGKFPILADHNPSKQIGWNEKASEDDTGLLVKGAIDLNVQAGVERFSLAKKALKIGAPMGLSIGYFTIKAEPDSDNPRIRLLRELKLFEYSLVTFPMNTEALITAAKNIGALDKARCLIEQLKLQGISRRDLEIALHYEAAKVDEDPTAIGQSIDNLILKFRS